jgi:hypothetical protein
LAYQDFLSKQVTAKDVLIPMPSSLGYSTDTKALCEGISKKTGAKIFDCLDWCKKGKIFIV